MTLLPRSPPPFLLLLTPRPSATASAKTTRVIPTIQPRGGRRRYSEQKSPSSPTAGPPRKKVTITTLRDKYAAKTPIVMTTAHDFPSGLVADESGMDIVLIGDSLAMVALGMPDTNQLKLDDILHHCRAVVRGARYAFTVGDLPMGSYEASPEQAITSSLRMIQDGRVEAIKLEGGKEISETISRITSIGIPVLGHVGLMPQRSHSLGGFRVQGKTASSASSILTDALALQSAGCFGIVLEAVPAPVAALISEKIKIPTIGVGAGAGCSGQVLVQGDLLGNSPEGKSLPKFVKRYANVFEESKRGLMQFGEDVRNGSYPAPEHTYPISAKEMKEFEAMVEARSAECEDS